MNDSSTSKKKLFNVVVNAAFVLLILLDLFLIVYNNKDNFEEYRDVLVNVNYFTLFIVLLFTMLSPMKAWDQSGGPLLAHQSRWPVAPSSK